MPLAQPDPLAPVASSVPPPLPPHRPLLVFGAFGGAFVLGAVILSGACRLPGSSAPAAGNELAELGRLVDEV